MTDKIKMVHATCYIPEDLMQKIDADCKEQVRTRSQLIYLILKEHYERKLPSQKRKAE